MMRSVFPGNSFRFKFVSLLELLVPASFGNRVSWLPMELEKLNSAAGPISTHMREISTVFEVCLHIRSFPPSRTSVEIAGDGAGGTR